MHASQGIRRVVCDPFSAISHYVGAVLAVAATVWMVFVAVPELVPSVAVLLYGLSMIALYMASGLYHTFGNRATWLRKLDHAAIFLLIVGTYLPICIVGLGGSLGTGLFIFVSALGVVGLLSTWAWDRVPQALRVVLYIVMGWFVVGFWNPFAQSLGSVGMGWLLAGGLTYTIGVVFYATNWPKVWRGVFEGHDLWHLFVLGGSICHFVVVARILLGLTP